MADSPSSVPDSPFILSPGASPPVRGVWLAAAWAKEAFPGSNSSKKARRKLELGSKPSIQDNDLQSIRAYKKELEAKKNASTVTRDLSLKALLYFLKLKQEHLEGCQKDGKKLSIYRADIRGQVEKAFSLSTCTFQKILDDFNQGGGAYQSVRAGQGGKRATRVPQTPKVVGTVQEFVRDKQSRQEHVTGRQVLDFLIEKKIVKVPKDDCGFFDKKDFAAAQRATNHRLKKNGYRQGKRVPARVHQQLQEASRTVLSRGLLG
jgi:hypothetical protein